MDTEQKIIFLRDILEPAIGSIPPHIYAKINDVGKTKRKTEYGYWAINIKFPSITFWVANDEIKFIE